VFHLTLDFMGVFLALSWGSGKTAFEVTYA
jgi:hypothetical protein